MLGEGGSKIFGKKIDVGGGGVKIFCFPPPHTMLNGTALRFLLNLRENKDGVVISQFYLATHRSIPYMEETYHVTQDILN